ncbi:peptidase S1 and S6 chymotrypsin/Hap (plasmid) [Rhizobium leguminosarum bv. trifolii WSM1325]|uniref:Peptidase S1 and S6 chymotrypsin/Hap n=1 Tax=Rhizobium leguminosarum bv. trifolii (strain WSM1325) TaxID=395491 RepID=C6B8N3_RHILS|nr:S1 family peptidase [Rhizobium leguminosarum]ACS60271.1 peptidase S1 and S6 chymotrypsin/Hap [Rhizobium leguminosarum bv. trifolii WSM1325]
MNSPGIASCRLAFTLAFLAIFGVASAQDDSAGVHVRYGEAALFDPEAGDAMVADDTNAVADLKAESQEMPSARVANGVDVVLSNFSEVVKIEFSDARGRHACTGVMLSPDAVLTAGHCGCGRAYEVTMQTAPVERAGDTAFSILRIEGGPFLFPGYSCSYPETTGVGHDLALMRIVPPAAKEGNVFELDDGVAVELSFPVIRSGVQVLSQQLLNSIFILGFGRTETGAVAKNLQGANVGVLSRHCIAGHVFMSYCAPFREFSLGRNSNTPGIAPDSCGGDSGGPAYRMDSDLIMDPSGLFPLHLSRRTLVGIVSRAVAGVVHPYRGYCGGGGIYTTVGTRPVLDWLRSQKVSFLYDPNPTYRAAGG